MVGKWLGGDSPRLVPFEPTSVVVNIGGGVGVRLATSTPFANGELMLMRMLMHGSSGCKKCRPCPVTEAETGLLRMLMRASQLVAALHATVVNL